MRYNERRYSPDQRFEHVISTVRAAGVPVYNVRPLLSTMAALGQPLCGCQTPDGYRNTEAAWLSPAASLRRISLALAPSPAWLCRAGTPNRGNLPIGVPPTGSLFVPVSQTPRHPIDPAALMALFGTSLSARTRAAMILGSPDLMMR